MKEDVARSVLRIVGVVTVLVGVILTAQVLVAWIALSSAIEGAPAKMQVARLMNLDSDPLVDSVREQGVPLGATVWEDGG